MQDPTGDKIREQSKLLTSQQLRGFVTVFSEFEHLNESPVLRRLVAIIFLFSQNMFAEEDSPAERISDLKKLCVELLGEDLSPEQSELFKRLDTFGKGRKGAANPEKFLQNFQKFLSDKLTGGVVQGVSLLQVNPNVAQDKISFDELKQLFPVFDEIAPADLKLHEKAINELLILIFRFRSVKNKMAERYKMMWFLNQMGELVEEIVPKKCKTTTLADLKGKMSSQNNLLDKAVQVQLFITARNIACDFFQVIYPDQMSIFLEDCSNLFMGRVIPDNLYVRCYKLSNSYERGEDLIPLLKGDQAGQAKMFSQMGYFLDKAKKLFESGAGHEAACMALVAAGTCARLINKAGIAKAAKKPVKFSSTPKLMYLRSSLAHSRAPEYAALSVYDTMTTTLARVDGLIQECESDAQKVGLNVNVSKYIQVEKPSENSESPRIFKKI